MGLGDSIRIGAKAANMGEMSRIDRGAHPAARGPFAIPFSFYQRHLEDNGLAAAIDSFLADYEAGALGADDVRARLFDLRWRIFVAPINEADLAAVMGAMSARWPAATGVRFRSSTNVEDLAEFSGAGLYTSAGASADEGPEKIADAIRVVWASAWNHPGVRRTRVLPGRQHAGVRMGVLVHPAFDNELANGVAVTINEFADNRPAFFINSQIGEVSVTNPTGQAVPEQILYYTWYEEPEVRGHHALVAGRGPARLAGEPGVFTEAELEELAPDLLAIHNHFHPL